MDEIEANSFTQIPDLTCFLNFVITGAHGLIFGERND